MASRSFTFKRTTNASVGSYLQQEPALLFGGDDDSALRGDNYVNIPDETVSGDAELLLDVDPISYSGVRIQWEITTGLAASAGATPTPVELVIVYSPTGYPQTVNSGTVLVRTKQSSGLQVQEDLLSGKWAYYSMFVLYSSTDVQQRSWYELIGSTEVLVPTDYGSTDDLWKRIPRHYRMQDESLAEDEDSDGPLYRALDVFGWDINRLRSLIDYQMVAKDPNVAEVESLDALAYELGLPVNSIDLGPTRLRNLLNNARINNSIKGTLTGVEQTLSAVVGSPVEITPTRPERLAAAQRSFSSIVTSGLPTGTQWNYSLATNVSCAASASGIAVTRSSGSNYVYTVLSTPVTISQASQYRTYYDVLNINGASVVGAYMSTTHASASAWTLETTTGFISSGPPTWVRQTSSGTAWTQAPQDHGIVGNGTFTTTTAYLHIVVVLGPGATSLLIRNPSLIALDNYPYTIDVFSERANLIKDPKFSTLNLTTQSAGNLWNWSKIGAGTVTLTRSGNRVTATSSGGSAFANFNTYQVSNLTPLRTGIEYSFSIIDVDNRITNVSLVNSAFQTIVSSATPYRTVETASGTRKYWALKREYDEPWIALNINGYIQFQMTLGTGASGSVMEPLLEPLLRGGEYFDGDSINGGWLRGNNFTGTADFRWGDGGANASFSYYATDYLRMQEAVTRLVPYLVPVTETNVTLRFNRLFGQTTSGMP